VCSDYNFTLGTKSSIMFFQDVDIARYCIAIFCIWYSANDSFIWSYKMFFCHAQRSPNIIWNTALYLTLHFVYQNVIMNPYRVCFIFNIQGFSVSCYIEPWWVSDLLLAYARNFDILHISDIVISKNRNPQYQKIKLWNTKPWVYKHGLTTE